MQNITFINQDNLNIKNNKNILNEMFKLRDETFKNRLGWEVNSKDGLEIDDFDRLHPSYITMSNTQGNVIGCWRALPTQGSYMLKNTFPELLRGEEVPSHPSVWEISRFAITKNRPNNNQKMVSSDTAQLVKSFYTFAKQNNITDYVLVTTVACERILRQLGVTMRRMGDKKSMQIGIERSVALWVEVDEKLNIQIN